MLIAKAERGEMEIDSDIFASMLRAVGAFVHDSLSMMGKEGGMGLNSLGYEKYKILVQTLDKTSLAIVIEGNESEFLIEDMKDTLAEIGNRFDEWTGDVDEVDDIIHKISWYIDSGKYDGKFLVDDPKIRQENLFDNVLMGIQRLSVEKTLIVFLDDLQWADPSTLTLLHYLSRNIKGFGILLLGTYRPEDMVETPGGQPHQLELTMQNMSREDLWEKVELKRLGAEDTGRVIESMLGNVKFDHEFYQKVFKETGGTPFYVLEVVKLLVAEECICPDEEGTWMLVSELDSLDIPSKVYDVVKRRLDRLLKEQRDILECASVIGDEFQSDVVGNITGMNRIQLLRNLGEIEKTHKLIHSFEKKYVFDHSKIREVLYNGIIDELKQEYHRIVADTLVELFGEKVDDVVTDVAHHYFEARDEKAAEYLIKAGDKAKEQYANEEAIKFYRNAFGLLKDEKGLRILESQADLENLIGKYTEAIENFRAGMEIARDDETKARLLRKVAISYDKMGDRDNSLEALTSAAETIRDVESAEQGRILVSKGNFHYRSGDFDSAISIFHEAMKIFDRKESDEKDMGDLLRSIGNIHLSKGEYDDALRYYEQGLAIMEKAGNQHGIAAILSNIGIVHIYTGDLQKSLDVYGKSLDILKKIGVKYSLSLALNNMGGVYYSLGNAEKALEHFYQSLDIREKIGDLAGVASSLGNLGGLYFSLGELDKSLDYNERCLNIKEDIGDNVGVALALNNIGNLNLALAGNGQFPERVGRGQHHER